MQDARRRDPEDSEQRHGDETDPDEPELDQTVAILDDGPLDIEDELVGGAVSAPDEFASPEDSTMSVRNEAPGATDHEDRHPVPDEL